MSMDRERDLDPIRTQGEMLNGCATTGYLNLLGVRSSRNDFFNTAAIFTARHGQEHAWPSYIKVMAEFEKATVETLHWNWEQSPVMVVQIFTGDNSAGYWSLLIIDRSSYKPGIFVYFDSLGGGKHTMQEVKNLFTLFLFCRRNSKWIHACVPKQGSGTNDCGVYMTCLATAFEIPLGTR